MMTTMAALLGGVPLALGTGTGSELRRPLGIAIVGGLIFSQVLTLYTTPVIYLAFDRLAKRLRRGPRSASRGGSQPAGSMNISAPFIQRPVATTLLTVALALAGAVAYQLLAGLAAAAGGVSHHSGVSAACPAPARRPWPPSVATPLERQFGRIAGVTEMTSTSILGSTTITLQFDLNRNIDAAARDVQAAINAARGQLPANLPNNPIYRKVNPADAPIMILALTSDIVDSAPNVRRRLHDPAAETLPGAWRRPGHRRRRRAAGRARGRQSDGLEQLWARPGGRPRRARQRQRQPPKGRASDERQTLLADRAPTISC